MHQPTRPNWKIFLATSRFASFSGFRLLRAHFLSHSYTKNVLVEISLCSLEVRRNVAGSLNACPHSTNNSVELAIHCNLRCNWRMNWKEKRFKYLAINSSCVALHMRNFCSMLLYYTSFPRTKCGQLESTSYVSHGKRANFVVPYLCNQLADLILNAANKCIQFVPPKILLKSL